MGRPISYEMVELFVDSAPSWAGAIQDPVTGHVRLDFIQSHDLSFSVDRTPLKQIGSSAFATRQTQLAPDVNFSVNYLLNDGWNDNFIGLNINTGSYQNPFSNIFNSENDRNFYLFITDRAGNDSIASNHGSSLLVDENLNVLGIGNCYLSNYNISLNVNGLASVSCDFLGANAEITKNFSTVGELTSPAINPTGSGEVSNQIIIFNINSNPPREPRYLTGFRYIFDSGCPYQGCLISASPALSSGLRFGFDFDNFQSLDISIPLERKSLYGFGNNYPSARKIQKPIIGTMSLSAIVDTFYAETLANTFEQEDKIISGFNFDITFGNWSQVPKFGIKIQNARLDSYSISQQIGPVSQIETSWSFEVNESTGILMSGSYSVKLIPQGRVTESINL